MTQATRIVVVASLVMTIGGPLCLGVVGAIRHRAAPTDVTPTAVWDWKLTLHSALLYSLAFSLIFLIQELFLVLPKALTPGLRPTLFHNNHQWDGDNPLANLFQGTGALSILATAIAFAFWLRCRPPRAASLRLFVIWMTFHGFFQSLPQVVVGAVLPRNDVGMAMTYLRFPPAVKGLSAFVALTAIALISTRLTRPLLEMADHPRDIDNPRTRTQFIARVATLPALIGIPLIVLFRVPGTIDQVLVVPVAEAVIGIPWIQAGAWRVTSASPPGGYPVRSIRYPLIALILLLLVFQLVLRPGIPFF